MRVTVEVNEKLLKEVQERLGKFSNRAPNAIVNALNRAATNVRSNISKEVRKEYIIKAGDVKASLSTIKASRGNLAAEVRSIGRTIPLDRFKVTPRTVNPRRKAPIKVAVKKGGVKELMGAFVLNLHGIKVFQRKGKPRLPIKRLFGPSIPQMLGNEEVRQQIEKRGQETFHRRLDHEINRILEKGRSS